MFSFHLSICNFIVKTATLGGKKDCCGQTARLATFQVSLSASPTQVYETPFFVAVDHEKKKVVISIRGTLSLKVKRLLEHFILTL